MKVRVIEVFEDKITHKMHEVGEVFDLADKVRVEDLVERKLAEVVEEPKRAKATKKK